MPGDDGGGPSPPDIRSWYMCNCIPGQCTRGLRSTCDRGSEEIARYGAGATEAHRVDRYAIQQGPADQGPDRRASTLSCPTLELAPKSPLQPHIEVDQKARRGSRPGTQVFMSTSPPDVAKVPAVRTPDSATAHWSHLPRGTGAPTCPSASRLARIGRFRLRVWGGSRSLGENTVTFPRGITPLTPTPDPTVYSPT